MKIFLTLTILYTSFSAKSYNCVIHYRARGHEYEVFGYVDQGKHLLYSSEKLDRHIFPVTIDMEDDKKVDLIGKVVNDKFIEVPL